MFGEAKRSDEPPPNVKAVFDKIRRLLDDEAAQNELYMPEMSRSITAGPDVDRVADGVGDFGRDLRNPIPVNCALGELIYISQLVTATGSRFLGHRLGSVSNVDVYEIVSLDRAQWGVLYFDLYHPRKSRLAPTGLRLNPYAWILATNYRLDDFPRGLRNAVSRCTREFIGLPFVSRRSLTKRQPELFSDRSSISAIFDGLRRCAEKPANTQMEPTRAGSWSRAAHLAR